MWYLRRSEPIFREVNALEVYRKKIFPALAGALWLGFLTLDLTGLCDSRWVKFFAICLCCATALLGTKTTDGKLVAVAMCFTVAADWFLLVRDDHYLVGIGLFIIVQFIYAYRLYRFHGKIFPRWWLIARADITLLFLFAGGIIFTFLRGLSLFVLLPFFYFSNLCINTAEAFALKKRTFAWGLLLFVCCDICVGVYNLLGILPALTAPGMWFFYLPSQVLIVLSQETGDTYEKAL